MSPRFFIQRPIFAAVISIVIVLFGLVSMTSLPIARYPEIAPPTINVSAQYPGADARTVADTVAAPIEQEVNGVEGMTYMNSVCGNDGSMSLTVSFATGTDLDTANVLVQNRVSVAEAKLPEEVKRLGIQVKKKSTDVAVYLSLFSPDQSKSDLFLSNYATLRLRDEIARVYGVGDVSIFGAGEYAMRVWLDPAKLASLGLTAGDVNEAIGEQNVQVAAGQIGGEPAPLGQAFQYSVNVRGRLVDAEEFGDIIIQRDSLSGGLLRLKDVATIELGSSSYDYMSRFNGQPSSTMAVYQIPGANLLDVVDGIAKKMENLSGSFPQGLAYKITYDGSLVVRSSLKEVVQTLFITLLLVVLTVYAFLQNFRATLIPAITIPVSLIGTFAVMALFGYSINILTLFGLVLVIGIVVDDAIVVVENCTRHLQRGHSPKEAAMMAMDEVTGPVIATTLVLLAVFVPTLFLGGITGRMFQQFAAVISIATVFSSINALTLSPALCGVFLRANEASRRQPFIFRLFNDTLEKITGQYGSVVNLLLRRASLGIALFLGLSALAVFGLGQLPTGFVPQEDEGSLIVPVQLPDAASLPRTAQVINKIGRQIADIPGVADLIEISGYSLLDGSSSSNMGFIVVVLDNWSERASEELSQDSIVDQINGKLAGVNEAVAVAIKRPSLPGVGVSGGFTFMLQDRGGAGLEALQSTAQSVIENAAAQSGLAGVRTTFRSNVPQLLVDVDREQAKTMGVPLSAVFEALQTYLGATYVNDFTYFGRTYQVKVQAEAESRLAPSDINELRVRNSNGELVPLGAIVTVRETTGPQSITRHNSYPAVKILGSAAPGFSSGEALTIMEGMAAQTLPSNMGYEWSDLSYEEKLTSGGGMAAIFAFAILMVYLILAAQYESWTIPLSVCLGVPTALLGAVGAAMARGLDNNVYTQIGIVLLIGLSTKSAILIVEFAKTLHDEGKSAATAAVDAARLRLRAVLMTAFSFILGVLPLLIADGAGAASRQTLGTVVFGGMLIASTVGLLVVPLLYYVIQSTQDRYGNRAHRRELAPEKNNSNPPPSN